MCVVSVCVVNVYDWYPCIIVNSVCVCVVAMCCVRAWCSLYMCMVGVPVAGLTLCV